MKLATVAALCIALASAAAMADTFYRYRDRVTGRDVFVDRLEQVPTQYRSQAKIVFESGGLTNWDEIGQQAPIPPGEQGLAEKVIKKLGPATGFDTSALAHATASKNPLVRGPAVAGAVVDAKLHQAGSRPLAAEERARLAGMLTTVLVVGMVAGVCALLVWIALIVCAFRDKRPAWGVVMILLSPAAYLYLILHFGKGKPLLKAACWLGLLSPALVGLVAAWRFHAWMRALLQARGVQM